MTAEDRRKLNTLLLNESIQNEDPLAAAKGMTLGCLFGIVFWGSLTVAYLLGWI